MPTPDIPNLDETDFNLLGVLRGFGRRGYVTSDTIIQRAYPHLVPGSPRYNPRKYLEILYESERRLDRLAILGMVEADDLDLDVGTFRCYRIVENGGLGGIFSYNREAAIFREKGLVTM